MLLHKPVELILCTTISQELKFLFAGFPSLSSACFLATLVRTVSLQDSFIMPTPSLAVLLAWRWYSL